ncbi:MAG: hypothetical protein H7062_20170 [Candidatus Saccharimonas sp.]|nr:hypothetical protein [Planctomycetaceae bacterium]
MTTLFLVCALFGGTLLICQTVMTLIGLGGDHDFSHDGGDHDLDHHLGGHDASGASSGTNHDAASSAQHDSTWFFGIVTLRTAVAALTFFGLAGMAAQSSDLSPVPSLAIGVLAGFAAMYGVHWMMRQISRLKTDGSVRIDNAVGMTGTVYLRIPGHLGGAGKIQLNLQNRTVELSAWTDRSEIATGATVLVTRVVGPDSVEVAITNAAAPTAAAT